MQIHLAIRSFYRNFVAMKHLLTLIAILLSLCCCTSQSEHQSMRQQLDSINQRNRNDQPFTVADVEPYVAYFDRHGSANDRLLAHYLLGRAYHEAGEAPLALQCYHEAVDCADTTAADCDFAQLSRVYGQMGEIFYDQSLYKQQLHYLNFAIKYAWDANDTLAALANFAQKCMSYIRLEQSDSAIFFAEKAAARFRQYGYHNFASMSLGCIIWSLINIGKYEKAKRYSLLYEKESGLLDNEGNIQQGREAFYHVKGLLYLKENHLDSAEYWFRKELRDGKDFNNQNGGALGLAMVYEQRCISDSAAKYGSS